MNSSVPNSGMDGFAKAFDGVSGVASTAWGYAKKQIPSSDNNINGTMDYWFGKAFGAVSNVASAACGYSKQLSNSATLQQNLNILRVRSSQITDLQSLKGMCRGLGVILYELVDEDRPIMHRINVKTVGAVATVGIAAWGVFKLGVGVRFAAWCVYKLVGGLVKIVRFAAWCVYNKLLGGSGKKMMKNPGRPWELINKFMFRNDAAFRKDIFDRTHLLKKGK